MNEDKSKSVKKSQEYNENFMKYSDSLLVAYESINNLISKIGFTEELKSITKSIYLLKISYLELRKDHFPLFIADLNMPEIGEYLNKLMIQNDDLIEKAYAELHEIDK